MTNQFNLLWEAPSLGAIDLAFLDDGNILIATCEGFYIVNAQDGGRQAESNLRIDHPRRIFRIARDGRTAIYSECRPWSYIVDIVDDNLEKLCSRQVPFSWLDQVTYAESIDSILISGLALEEPNLPPGVQASCAVRLNDGMIMWLPASSIAANGTDVYWISLYCLFQGEITTDGSLSIRRSWRNAPQGASVITLSEDRIILLSDRQVSQPASDEIEVLHEWPREGTSRSVFADGLCLSTGVGPNLYWFDIVTREGGVRALPRVTQVNGIHAIARDSGVTIAALTDLGTIQCWQYNRFDDQRRSHQGG